MFICPHCDELFDGFDEFFEHVTLCETKEESGGIGMSEYLNISELIGKTLINIVKSDDNDEIRFYTENGEVYLMYHEQDCCESVFIEDICGDLDDLIGSPIVMAEEVIEERPPLDKWDESYTWTFYKFATNKGYVTIRWYGTSNGYYSESVDFIKAKEESE